MVQFLGNAQGTTPASYQIYDNVIDGAIHLGAIEDGTSVYNNLIRTGETNYGLRAGIAANTSDYQVNAWNNIVIPSSGGILAFSSATNFSVGGPTAPLTYLDYNVYAATPTYLFGSTFYTEAQMQTNGFELHTTVTAASNIFVDQVSYVLQPAFQTAGRYGDPVGPRFPIAQILNTNRYGPGASN